MDGKDEISNENQPPESDPNISGPDSPKGDSVEDTPPLPGSHAVSDSLDPEMTVDVHDEQEELPPVKEGIIAWFTRNHVAANLLLMLIVIAGIISIFTVRKEFFPDFALDIIRVEVPYLGAAPEEVEEGVLIKIEEAIQDLEGIDEMTSTASEGLGQVTIEVESGYDALNLLDRVKVRVDAITTFPEETEKPNIYEVTRERDAIRVQLYGDTDEATLKEYAKLIRDEILDLPSVTRAEIEGTRNYEVSIEVSEKTLREYGLSFDFVVSAVQNSSLDLPSGSIETPSGEILLRSKGQAYRAEDFKKLVLLTRPDGTRLTLGQIADVKDTFEDVDIFMRYNGKPSVSIAVYRVGEQNLLQVSREVREFVEQRAETLPSELSIDYWADNSRLLDGRIDLMLRNGFFGAILVFISLTLFLRLRVAFFVMLGLPVSFLGALAVMPLDPFSASINMITLFGFIVVLGIVVDDAIVVGENVYTTVRKYGHTTENVIRGAEEVALPVTFGVLTTVAAFVPILLIPGSDGQIWANIGLVVILCLLFSLVESKLILPAHLAAVRLYSPVTKKANPLVRLQRAFAGGMHWFVEKVYRPVADTALRWRYVTLTAFVVCIIITVGLFQSGFVRFVFFPDVPSDFVVASLEMAEGTPEDATLEASKLFEEAMKKADQQLAPDQKLVQDYLSFSLSESKVQFIAELIPSENRKEVGARDFVDKWRENLAPIPGAEKTSFTGTIGPGNRTAIDFQLEGNDVEQLDAAAAELKEALEQYPGVYDVADSFTVGKQEIKLNILPEAEVLGLTQNDLARQVRAGFYGAEAQRVQRGKDEVKIMIRYPEEERKSINTLEEMRVRGNDGREVPFESVAQAEYGRGYAVIERTDRRRVVHVTAQVDKENQEPDKVIKAVQEEELVAILDRYPGVSVTLSGESEDQQVTLSAMLRNFVIALFVIYALMAVPLKSYLQPFIIMFVIPFGIVGAVIGHMLFQMPISVLSLCGIIALSGVVINDGIVMVDFINRNIARGLPILKAVREAGAARFRPIILTSLTTFVGLSPMLAEQSLQAQFLIPMAVSLAFGILFATVITLVLLPSLYIILNDVTRGTTFLFSKAFGPTGEGPRDPESRRPVPPPGRSEPDYETDPDAGQPSGQWAPWRPADQTNQRTT